MSLQIDLVTLFPDFFKSPLSESIMKRAQAAGLVKIFVHNLRDYTHDNHKTADDKPFGGGAGMVMKPEPLFECIEAIEAGKPKNRECAQGGLKKGYKVLLGPHGKPMSQTLAKKLAKKKRLILVAGHYEGIDERVRTHLMDDEISIGDFITMGGEAPALCVMEAVVRLIPGVLGNKESIEHESFQSGLLEYPQYTRPRDYRGWKVPDVLVSGHHKEVLNWREKQALKITKKLRPDLLKNQKSGSKGGK